MIKFIKNPIVIILFVIVVGGIIALSLFGKESGPKYDYIAAERGDLVLEVSVTGKVRPSHDADLAFEKIGKISKVYVDVGDRVTIGQSLVRVDNAELTAQLAQASAEVESARAKLLNYQANLDYAKIQLEQAELSAEVEQIELDEIKRGTRPEEIQIAETKVASAQKVLDDNEINLANVENKAVVDLEEDYNAALSAVASSVTVGTNAIFTITNIQISNFYENNQDGIDVSGTKASAVYALLGGENAGRATNDFIGQLSGGAKADVGAAQADPTNGNIDNALVETKEALRKIKEALDIIPTSGLTSTERSDITTEKTNINNEITTLSGKQQAIEVQKASNLSAISLAESKVNDAKSALSTANDELALKEAGAIPEQIFAQEIEVAKAEGKIASEESQVRQIEADIASQEAQIKKAEASVQNYQAQIAKTIIHSPIKGIVTRQEAKVGEIVSANAIIVSLISETQFQIEANVPEADIAKVKIGNQAEITLDAYGNDELFAANVIAIDPAETVIDGVSTYKVTLQFSHENGRIKSGMTANINILSDKRENIIAIPQRALTTKNGDKIVRIVDGEVILDRIVETGLRGSDGNIEIISGVSEGDNVIIFIEKDSRRSR